MRSFIRDLQPAPSPPGSPRAVLAVRQPDAAGVIVLDFLSDVVNVPYDQYTGGVVSGATPGTATVQVGGQTLTVPVGIIEDTSQTTGAPQ